MSNASYNVLIIDRAFINGTLYLNALEKSPDVGNRKYNTVFKLPDEFNLSNFEETVFDIAILGYRSIKGDQNDVTIDNNIYDVIKKKWPDIQILFVSATPDDQLLIDCLRDGAADILRKPTGTTELVLRINNIAKYVDLLKSEKQRDMLSADSAITPGDDQREEATKALENFIKEFRQDHHFGNEWAAEKGVLIEALESGKAYIQNTVINARIGTMMTVDVLKEIIAKYEQAAVGGTISAMAQKVIDLLMDMFKDTLG
jgi:DNA-binding NarL/FixJ family response regulator